VPERVSICIAPDQRLMENNLAEEKKDNFLCPILSKKSEFCLSAEVDKIYSFRDLSERGGEAVSDVVCRMAHAV
ncbi:hypothetical protein AVEN_228093-1, partial [Araneus ventricosus]